MPTPARRATASRLASAPPALNTALAASSTRSRLRTASARGFRAIAVPGAVMSLLRVYSYPSWKRRYPPYILGQAEDTSVYVPAATGGQCGASWRRDDVRPWHRLESCMSFSINLTVNGVPRDIALSDPRVTLL